MELTDLTKPLVNKVKPVPFDKFQKSGDWMIRRGCVYYTTMGNFVKGMTMYFHFIFFPKQTQVD